MSSNVAEPIFKEALSRFPTGVTIVTVGSGHERNGTTVNAFTSISLAPPVILVSLDRSSVTGQLLASMTKFCVNILNTSPDHIDLAKAFATRTKEWSYRQWIDGPWGPFLNDGAANLGCEVCERIVVGDHTIFLGEVQEAIIRELKPLIYVCRNFV